MHPGNLSKIALPNMWSLVQICWKTQGQNSKQDIWASAQKRNKLLTNCSSLFRKGVKYVQNNLIKTVDKNLKFCKLKVIFKIRNWLRKIIFLFSLVRLEPETLRSNGVSKLPCGRYASFIGKTHRHKTVRVSEHQGILQRKRAPVKRTLLTSVRGLTLFIIISLLANISKYLRENPIYFSVK